MPTNTDSDAAWKEALNTPEMGRLIDQIRNREFSDGPRSDRAAKAAKDYRVEEVVNNGDWKLPFTIWHCRESQSEITKGEGGECLRRRQSRRDLF